MSWEKSWKPPAWNKPIGYKAPSPEEYRHGWEHYLHKIEDEPFYKIQEWEPFYEPIDDEPDTSLWDELWEDENE